MSSVSTLQRLLASFEPFRGVDQSLLAEICAESTPCTCSAGHELLSPQTPPEHVYVLIEGRARLLHHDPGVSRPLTLALSHPGDLLGWAGYTRRHPCEWATASTNLKLISIPVAAIERLERESDSFRSWLDRSSSPSEFIQVLEPSLRRRPHAEPDEREVMRRLLPHMQLITYRGEYPTLSSDFRWFWSSAPHPIGQEVTSQDFGNNFSIESQPLRLVRIASSAYERAMELTVDDKTVTDEVAGGTSPLQGDRYADLAPISSSIPGQSDNNQQSKLTADLTRLPVVTGIGPVEQSMACLQMLAMYFNIPFRRDIMERICTQELKDRSANLGQLAGMCSVMGFHPTLLNLPSQQVPRAHVPCLALIRDQPSIIYKIQDKQVLAVCLNMVVLPRS